MHKIRRASKKGIVQVGRVRGGWKTAEWIAIKLAG